MLKVIIADDERIIRETISRLIDWQSLDMELAGVCKNGIEAYDMMLDETPDIVLTDIRMPGLSGIDLIERAAGANLDVQFILLSGFGEFSYAQSAMKYGVRHYLLKPCSEEQIIASLRAVAADCYARRASRQIERQQAQLQATFLQSILLSIINEAGSVTDGNYERLYEPFARFVDFYQTEYELSYLHGLTEEDLVACYRHILDYHRRQAPTLPLYGVYVHGTLIRFCEVYTVQRADADRMLAALPRAADGPALTNEAHVLPNLAAVLNEVLPIIARHGTIRLMDGPRPMVTYNFHGAYRSVKELCRDIAALLHGEAADIPERLQEMLTELKRQLNAVNDRDFFLQLCSAVLLEFASTTTLCSPVDATECILQLQQCANVADAQTQFCRNLDAMAANNAAGRGDTDSIVPRILQYVQSNLSNPDLTLKWIAEQYLFMNVDYISRKFVHETGQKFSSYLTEQRIQRAKALLAETGTEKIQQIAGKVGCGNNPQYFSQIFKKHTGMTPTAYARMLRGET